MDRMAETKPYRFKFVNRGAMLAEQNASDTVVSVMIDRPLSHRNFIRAPTLAAAAAAGPASLASARSPKRRPNILYLCSDQQRWETMGNVPGARGAQ